MTLEEAVAVLNERMHLGFRTWAWRRIETPDRMSYRVADEALVERLYAFEAIAIAQAYVMEKG